MQKVLFFDDQPSITTYLVKNLQENFGWKGDREITFVSTVEDLCQQINQCNETFDIFVLDVMAPMPSSGELKKQFSLQELEEMQDGRNFGLVMAKKIRRLVHYERTPILYLSAKIIPPISDMEKRYTAYIRKPISPEEISKKMDELLNAH